MSVNSEAIRVVIADDEPGMRMIMRKMIEKAEGFTPVSYTHLATDRTACRLPAFRLYRR